MTKYGRWGSPKPSPRSHIDPENDEQLKWTKIEIEDKVTKILKLVKNEDQDRIEGKPEESLKKESELVELIEEFHKQYQSLYALYVHLRGELRENFHGKKEKEVSSSSTSSSESEYYSPDEVGSESGTFKRGHQKVDDSIKQELETATLEITGLKHNLPCTSEENEALDSKYKVALSQKQESEKIINDLRIEAEQRQDMIQKLMDESSQLKKKLGEREREVLSSAEMHERKTSAQIMKLEDQIIALKLELESLRAQKRVVEEQIASKTSETKQLGEENLGMKARILELEMILKEKGDELSGVMKKIEDKKSNSMSKVEDLMAQVNNLQRESDSLQTQKRQLELQIEKQKKDSPECVSQAENQKIKLTSRIAGQQKTPKEREDTSKKLSKDRFQGGSKLNIQLAERKMEQLAEEFRKNIEDNIRLLYQRIQVAEQLHTETKEIYRTTKGRFEQEHRMPAEKIDEAEHRKMKDLSETANNMFTGLNSMVRKFEEDNGNFLNRISKVKNELQFAKKWVKGTKEVNKQLKEEVGNLVGQLQDKEKQESVIRKEVSRVEVKVSEEGGGEKLSLMKAVSQLEKKVGELERVVKEKEEGILGLGEEKREAIRQLCVGIDYNRSRYDRLKELISKTTVRSRWTP